ncbi:MAG: cobalt-precorrin 5A hydrolase [Tissierellia bacterium]|nr:cobalt-precorrin 5A hydrolase [Tissierellia bacterium]
MSIGLEEMTNIFCFSKSGYELSKKLQKFLGGNIYYSKDMDLSIDEALKGIWNSSESIVFVGATGIAVRKIAPHIKAKDVDPAVIVIDDTGEFVISLLSGHLGGANELAVRIAEEIGGTPVITTASDKRNIESVDLFAKRMNLYIEDLKSLIPISSLMVDGEKIAVYSEIVVKIGYKNVEYINDLAVLSDEVKGLIIISSDVSELDIDIPFCRLVPKNINLGIGCRKHTDSVEMREFILDTLSELNLSEYGIKNIGTIELKSDEVAIIDASKFFDSNLEIFSAEELSEVDNLFEGSEFVRDTVGVGSVSATSATLLGGKLLIEKKIRNGMTISVTKEI